MKSFNQLFKRTEWDDLIKDKKYWVCTVGDEWFKHYDCECVFDGNVLMDENGGYFTYNCIEFKGCEILIFEYLEGE